MSIVNIIHHNNETIFDWEKEEKSKIQKPEIYHSKFREKNVKSAYPANRTLSESESNCRLINSSRTQHSSSSSKKLERKSAVKEENGIFIQQPQSWGYSETLLRAPCNFLKKNEGIRLRKSALHKCIQSERKPPLPDWNQQKQQNSKNHHEKNFKIENIKNVKNTKPKTRTPKYVDTKRGDSHELHKSGMIPEYIHNKNYGRTPFYILKRKSYLWEGDKTNADEKSNDKFGLSETIQVNSSKAKLVNPKERMEILNGLKMNWNELYKAYQKLPLCTDTEHKKKRKTRIEDELRKLEKDISLIESNPIIYVYDNDDDNKQ